MSPRPNLQSLLVLLLAKAAACVAGSLAATGTGHPLLGAALAALALAYGLLVQLLAMAAMAGNTSAQESAGLMEHPGKHLVDDSRVLHLPEVNP